MPELPRRRLAAALFVTIAAMAGAAHADGIVPGHVLARVRPGIDPASVAATYGSAVEASVPDWNLVRLRLPRGATETGFVATLSRDRRLVYAETDTYVAGPELKAGQLHFAFDTGPDPKGYANSAYLSQIGVPSGGVPGGGQGVIVAILDTGATFSHPALAGRYLPGWNAIAPGLPPAEAPDGLTNAAMGHGTLVAGIVSRIAPDARLLPIRVLNADGVGTMFQVAQGVRYALSSGAKVLNLSLSCTGLTSVMRDALDAAELAGVTVVGAAGNDNTDITVYPAAGRSGLGVSAVEADRRKSPYANFGSWVRLVAPGSGIASTHWTGGYALASGTSFAAPMVSGAAAVLWSMRSDATARMVKESLMGTARSVDAVNPLYKGKLGKGLFDLTAASKKLLTL